MNQLNGLYAIWLREVKVYFREYSRLIGSILTPLLWLLVLGKGIGASIDEDDGFAGVPYELFIFPGILTMTVLFQSVFYGLYIVWDRKIDFLKEDRQTFYRFLLSFFTHLKRSNLLLFHF